MNHRNMNTIASLYLIVGLTKIYIVSNCSFIMVFWPDGHRFKFQYSVVLSEELKLVVFKISPMSLFYYDWFFPFYMCQKISPYSVEANLDLFHCMLSNAELMKHNEYMCCNTRTLNMNKLSEPASHLAC